MKLKESDTYKYNIIKMLTCTQTVGIKFIALRNMLRKWSASELSASFGPLSALGRRSSGVSASTASSTRLEIQFIVGPPNALIEATL